MMKLKRFAAAALALCMALTLLPAGALADDNDPGWSVSGTVLTVTQEYVPQGMAATWSAYASTITEVELGSAVSSVSGGAFKDFTALESFSLPEGNGVYFAENGVLYRYTNVPMETVLACYPAAHTETFAGESGLYMVPESVVSIAKDAFSGWETRAAADSTRSLKIYACAATRAALARSTYDGPKFPTESEGATVATYVPATGVRLTLGGETLESGAANSVEVGGTLDLDAVVAPEADEAGENGASFTGVAWRSLSPDVASVDASGVVTGRRAGSATITAATLDGGFTASTTVTVLANAVTGLTLTPTALTLPEGSSAALTAALTPYNPTDTSVTFVSTDASVAYVSADGGATLSGNVTVEAAALADLSAASAAVTVKAAGPGEAGVVAITQDGGMYAVCSVAVPEVSLNKSAVTLGLGQSETLYAFVQPGTLEDYTVTWSSGSEAVATVDANGKITPAAVGATTVTVSIAAGGVTKTASCTVTVRQAAVTRVTLDKARLDLDLSSNKTGQLAAAVSPAGTSDGSVSWTSDKPAVATVSAAGLVTAVAPGTAVVTATTADGGFTASCAVTVAATRVEDIALYDAEGDAVGDHTLALDATEALTAVLTPASPTESGIVWLSTDPGVVSLSAESGASVTLTAEKAGSARIVAVAKDGAKAASCTVTVPVTEIASFALNKTALEMTRGAGGANVSDATLTAAVKPADATYGAVEWYSSDPGVVTVSGGGSSVADGGKVYSATLTTVGPGRAAVVARTADGTMRSCAVTVYDTPTGAAVSMDALTLAPGASKQLYAVVLPATADQGVTWSSDKEGVATVDAATGLVTAVADGTATVTATSRANGGFTARCVVTVKTAASSVRLNKTALTLSEGASETLTATVEPDAATTKDVTWLSYNEAVATVANGVVTAVAPGTTKILAATADGGLTAECAVTVNATRVTGVTLDKSAVTLGLNGTETLTAAVAPDTALNRTVSWSTSDATVATVAGGAVAAKGKEGTAVITATVTDNGTDFTAQCAVTVARSAVTRVTLDQNVLSLELTGTNSSKTLTAAVKPDDASNSSVSWSASPTGIVTLTPDGKTAAVAAAAVGTAVVTVTTADGAFTATCAVTVAPTKVSGVSLGKTTLSLNKGETETLTAAVAPEGASDKTLNWVSTNTAAVRVDQTGKVEAMDPGSAVVIATTADGGFSAQCAVRVYQPVSGITIHKGAVTLNVGETDTLAAAVLPEDADTKSVTWSSSDEAVATVDENGVVTAVAGGAATITATSGADATKTATAAVTVRTAVTSVTLSETKKTLELGGTEGADVLTLTATVAPSAATNKAVNWYSSDPEVAEVSSAGKVTAKKAGSAAIVAVTADGGKSASCVVTVRSAVSGVALDKSTLTLEKGTSAGLIATVNPAATADQAVTWASSAPAVATVTNGVVVAVGTGTATITATSAADSTKSVSCAVTVTAETYAVGGITLDETSLTLTQTGTGSSKTLTATVTAAQSGAAATNRTVLWTSTDTSVVTVADGTVSAAGPGKATVIARTEDGGKTALCAVTVLADATGVSLSRSAMALDLTDNTSDTLTAAIAPYDAANQDLSWSVTGAAATLSATSGKTVTVSAAAVGEATVTVTTADGGFTASCAVTVAPTAVSRAEISAGTLSLIVGNSWDLSVTLTPEDSTAPTTVWSSSDSAVAEVSTTGKVTAKAVGTALVTATVTDKAGQVYTACCAVTVKPVDVESVSLAGALALSPGETGSLTAAVTPGNATYGTVAWRSTNESVATVSADESNGNKATVTALAVGTATVYATSADGKQTAACAVTVSSDKITGLTISQSALALTFVSGAAAQESAALTAALVTGGATGTISWTSSAPAVATVADGVVTAAGKGTATITASVTAGGETFTADCAVTVASAVTGVGLSGAALTESGGVKTLLLERGGAGSAATAALSAAVTPADASDTDVTWYTSNPAVADVDQNGNVSAVNPGSAVITVATADGGYAASCAVTVRNAVTSVVLNKTALALTVGETEALSVTVNEGADGSVTWDCGDGSVATVDENGVVTAVGAGTVTVKAASSVSSGVSASCTVTVNARTTAVTGVTLNKSELRLRAAEGENAAESETLTATVAPEAATNKNVTWTSTDTSVATVAGGTVTAVAPGKAAVIVTTEDGRYSAMCAVTVPEPEVVQVTGVTVTPGSLAVYVGDTGKALSAAVLPATATNPAVSWTSYDTDYVEVDADGKLNPKKATKSNEPVFVAAVADSGISGVCAVTVLDGVSSITLSSASLALEAGGPGGVLKPTILPATASAEAKELTWTSSNESVATVADGVVTAVGPGRATITVTPAVGAEGAKASCAVTVTQPVTGVTITPAALSLAENAASDPLTVTVTPANASNKAVAWSSSDTAVATVDDDGVVTGLKAGRATIYAVTADRGFTAACIVTVAATEVTGLTVSPGSATLAIGGEKQLNAAVTPSGATYGKVSWFSSNGLVATVSESGVVTAVSAGTAAITAATADGRHTATSIVTVQAAPASVTLSEHTVTLNAGDAWRLTAEVGPDGAAQNLSWYSSGEPVATVDENGVVTAVAAGTATITAASAADGSVKDTCTVTVNAAVSGVTLDHTGETLIPGGTLSLTATVSPGNAANKDITWVSSDADVAAVSDDGVVTAKKAGTATITAVTADGGHTASCKLTVPGLSLNSAALSVKVGASGALTAIPTPSGFGGTVKWESDSTDVTVDQSGVVTISESAAAGDTATIKAYFEDYPAVSAACTVTVTAQEAAHISIAPAAPVLKMEGTDRTGTLTATVTPATADAEVAWSVDTDGADVIELSATGGGTVTVTAKKPGSATVTATAGGVSAQSVVTVEPVAVTGVTIDGKSRLEVTLAVDEEYTSPTPAVAPSNATNRALRWISSDTSVATVDQNGVVTAKKAGKATVSVITADGGHTAEIAVTVPGIALSKDTLTLTVEETDALTAILTPAGFGTVKWSVAEGGGSVAEVDEDTGVITALAAGTATITATAGGVSASCTLTVKAKGSVAITDKDGLASMTTGGSKSLSAAVTPGDADQSVTWTSTDPSVLAVEESAGAFTATAKKAGSAALIATSGDGYVDTCAVTVSPDAASVTLESGVAPVDGTLTLYLGGTAESKLTASVLNGGGTAAANQELTWHSTYGSVADVEKRGDDYYVRAGAAGGAVIIATAADGGQASASISVTVWNKTKDITLNKDTLILGVGDDWGLSAAVSAESGTANPAVTWSVGAGGGEIVSVTDGGLVTALKAGTATVTATSADGVSASCAVTVREYVVSGTVDAPEMRISDGGSGRKLVSFAGTENTIYYYFTKYGDGAIPAGLPTAAEPREYHDTDTIELTADAVVKAYAVRGSFQSAVVTAVVDVQEVANSMALTDALGNSVETLAEAGESGKIDFTTSITLAEAASASNLYVAVYDTSEPARLIALSKYEYDVGDGDAATVITQTISLEIEGDVEIGSIKLMVLSDSLAPLMNAGSVGG